MSVGASVGFIRIESYSLGGRFVGTEDRPFDTREAFGRLALVLLSIAFAGRLLLGLLWVNPDASDRVMLGSFLAALGALCIASDWIPRFRMLVGAVLLVGGGGIACSSAFLPW